MTAFCFSSCSFIWRCSSAAFAASRSAIRRLRSAAENVPAAAGWDVPRLSDMIFPPITSAFHQRAGMAGDHQILVGLYNICADAAGSRADPLLMLAIGRLVEVQPQPAAGSANCTAHRRCIFADTGSENDAVKAAERRGERGDVPGDAVAKYLHREPRPRLVTRQELPK